MWFDLGFAPADGKENLGDAVAYVVFNQVLEQEQRHQHTHTRKDEVLKVEGKGNALVQKVADTVYAPGKQHRGEPGCYTHGETQQQQAASFRQAVK